MLWTKTTFTTVDVLVGTTSSPMALMSLMMALRGCVAGAAFLALKMHAVRYFSVLRKVQGSGTKQPDLLCSVVTVR